MAADASWSQPSNSDTEQSTLPMACTLDGSGMREQGERYAALGAMAESISYSPRKLEVLFPEDADLDLVAETLAIEQRCCPFLNIEEHGCLVTFQVAAPEHEAILGLIRDALKRGAP